MSQDSFDIICLSTAHWDAPLWTNRQRLMNILSEHHRVLYVEPGLFSKIYSADLLKRHPSRLLPNNWIRQTKNNLWIYAPNLLPLYRFQAVFQSFAWKVALLKIRRFCSQYRMHHPVLWVYSPEAIAALGKLNESLVIYDCVDNYAATPYYASCLSRANRLRQQEEILLREADVVTTTSLSLYYEKKLLNRNTFYVPNVGDAAHFGKSLLDETSIPEDIAHIEGPVIGFIGAVNAHKIDFNLIREVAQKTPSYQYVLIGPTSGWGGNTDTAALDLPNIHLMGPREYSLLPNYVKVFDVCIIPYAINEYTKHVFPLKFYEFMATGKPLVVTALPSLASYTQYVHTANTADEFVNCVRLALEEEDPPLRLRRIELAKQNTWHHRASQIEKYIVEAAKVKGIR